MGFEATLTCAADALQMLGTDYLDLLLLHHPFAPTPGCWGAPVWDFPSSRLANAKSVCVFWSET